MDKETAIKAHRAMWNWIAETIQTKKQIPEKDKFKDTRFPNIKDCWNYCYLCEYAYACAQAEQNDREKICQYCLLQWPESQHTIRSNKTNCCYYLTTDGLYDNYTEAAALQDLQQAYKIAKQIADLPKRE